MDKLTHSLNQRLFNVLSQRTLHPAVYERGSVINYAELADRVASCSYRLRQRGVIKADRIALQLRNTPEAIVLMLATLMIGAVPVPILPAYREKELRHILQMTSPKVVALPRETRRHSALACLQNLQQEGFYVEVVLVENYEQAQENARYLNLEAFCSSMQPVPQQWVEPMSAQDTAMMLLSSGTTGLPKAIARQNAGYCEMIARACEVFGLDQNSVYLAAMPVTHGFSLNCPGILGTLTCSGAIALADNPSAEESLDIIAHRGVTHTTLVPALLAQWSHQQSLSPRNIDSLWHVQVGGSRTSPELAASASRILGVTLQQCYGMSEGLLCFNRISDTESMRFHSQGRPLSESDEVQIVDENGNPVPLGESGELVTRGPYTITCYYQNPVADRRSFTDEGFYRTGDLAHADRFGNLVIDGRVNDAINRGGEKFSPEEIEELALQHPDINNAACVGAADPLYGEVPCLFICTDRAEISLGTIRRFFEIQGLALFKAPEKLIVVDAIPMKGIGKIDRLALRDLLAKQAPLPRQFPVEIKS